MKLTEEQEKMASELTSLQRKTVLNIVSGMSNRQAYLKAGGKATSDRSADQSVSRMLTNIKVKKFYDSLLNHMTEKAIVTKEEVLKILADDLKDDLSDYKQRHSAAKLITDMLGFNAPKKQELSGDISISEVVRKVVD